MFPKNQSTNVSYSPITGSGSLENGFRKKQLPELPPSVKPSQKEDSGEKTVSFLRRLFARGVWTRQGTSLFFAIGVLAAQGAVLHLYDGKPVTAWTLPAGITLNALISLLTTFLYMLLTMPLTTSLSQLKWNRYKTPRPLYDFHIVDQASRGVWGSLKLIFRMPTMWIGVSAALLTIAINAIGPLVQQVITIQIENRPVIESSNTLSGSNVLQRSLADKGVLTSAPSNTPSVPIAQSTFDWLGCNADGKTNQQTVLGNMAFNSWSENTTGVPINLTDFVWALQLPANGVSAIYSGIFSSKGENFDVPVTCGGANCSWPSYQTLGFQHQCLDISDQITINNDINSTWSNFMSDWVQQPVSPTTPGGKDLDQLQATPLASLPNGYNVSLLQIFSAHWNAFYPITTFSLDGNFTGVILQQADVEVGHPPNGGIGKHVASVYIDPLQVPVKVQERTSTVLIAQFVYLETMFDTAGISLGKTYATECSLDFAATEYRGNTTFGVFSETEMASVLGDVVPPKTASTRSMSLLGYSPLTSFASGYCMLDPVCPAPSNFTHECGGAPFNTWPFQEARLSLPINGSSSSNDNNNSSSGGNSNQKTDSTNNDNVLDMSIDPAGSLSVAGTASNIFKGNMSMAGWLSDFGPGGGTWNPFSIFYHSTGQVADALSSAMINSLNANPAAQASNTTLDDVMANTARSMSQYLRNNFATHSSGTRYESVAIYQVRWAWYSIPIALVALISLVVVATAVDTARKRTPVWTDSSLAVMVHGVREDDRALLLAQQDAERLHDAADTMDARLGGIHNTLTVVTKLGVDVQPSMLSYQRRSDGVPF